LLLPTFPIDVAAQSRNPVEFLAYCRMTASAQTYLMIVVVPPWFLSADDPLLSLNTSSSQTSGCVPRGLRHVSVA